MKSVPETTTDPRRAPHLDGSPARTHSATIESRSFPAVSASCPTYLRHTGSAHAQRAPYGKMHARIAAGTHFSTPSVHVGPASTLFTVTPGTPFVASAIPRDRQLTAALVVLYATISAKIKSHHA